MSAPVHVFCEEETDDPLLNVVHIVCPYCIDSSPQARPLLAYCGTDVTDSPELPQGEYGPDDCSMCVYLCSTGAVRCPACKRLSW